MSTTFQPPTTSLRLAESGKFYFRQHEEGTRYYARVSNVIQIGCPLWEGIDEETRLRSAELGTEVHGLAYELSQSSAPDELVEAFPEPLASYGRAWVRFQREMRFKPWVIEQALASEEHRFAGRTDAIGAVNDDEPAVIDYTIGRSVDAKRLQTAAYEKLWKELTHDKRRFKRLMVILQSNGRYAIYPMKNPNDWHAFQCLLGFHNWKRSPK